MKEDRAVRNDQSLLQEDDLRQVASRGDSQASSSVKLQSCSLVPASTPVLILFLVRLPPTARTRLASRHNARMTSHQASRTAIPNAADQSSIDTDSASLTHDAWYQSLPCFQLVAPQEVAVVEQNGTFPFLLLRRTGMLASVQYSHTADTTRYSLYLPAPLLLLFASQETT